MISENVAITPPPGPQSRRECKAVDEEKREGALFEDVMLLMRQAEETLGKGSTVTLWVAQCSRGSEDLILRIDILVRGRSERTFTYGIAASLKSLWYGDGLAMIKAELDSGVVAVTEELRKVEKAL